MSKTRAERTLAQAERVAAVFSQGKRLSRARTAMLADVPETSLARIMAHLRNHALDYEHTAMTIKIGGEWIYGWADVLHEHMSEHVKRRTNEKRSLSISRETLQQSLVEHPESMPLRRQFNSVSHRLEDVELEIEELTGQLRLIRREVDAA